MIILGIETSCDETAAALVKFSADGSCKLLAEKVASQIAIHAPHGGIVPELASRCHMETLLPLVQEVLTEAGLSSSDLGGIAATAKPGLLGSLLVGLSFAKSYAWTLGLPFIGVSHLEGHLNAPYLEHPEIPYPHVALLVSGGHTALYDCRTFGDYHLMGATRDDAAGEAFDKVAHLLDLGYPGGPVIDRMAKEGDSKAIHFPRSQVRESPLDFSFSGLKTAVRQYCEQSAGPVPSKSSQSTSLKSSERTLETIPRATRSQQHIADICASFQKAVVDSLIQKTMLAVDQVKPKAVLLTGGVACNRQLRDDLAESCKTCDVEFYVSSPRFCTDNAAMIAYTGGRRLLNGETSSLEINAQATEMIKGPLEMRH